MQTNPRFPNLFILNHPLIQHKLSHMRDRGTSTRTFRELLREITLLVGYEITRDLPQTTRTIDTPLMTRGDMNEEQVAGFRRMIEETVPMGRFGSPEEAADAVLFLASDRSSFITGIDLLVDGGTVSF